MKPPVERTHDVSSVQFHVTDLETFGKTLTCARNAAFPKKGGKTRYGEVLGLLIRCEETQLGVPKEIAELRAVFEKEYHFDAEQWQIPSYRSHNPWVIRISELLDAYEDKRILLIDLKKRPA